MKLKNPIEPFVLNYPFGYVNSYYTNQGMLGHNGVDLRAEHGQPVYAAHAGTCYLEIDSNGGNGVVIYSDEQFEFEGKMCFYKTIYWHLMKDNTAVEYSQKVKAGDLIGYADSTGISSGTHLHFGLKPVAQGEPAFTWYNVAQNNGYKGAIDPISFMDTKFVFTKTLKFGMWNNDVKELQKILNVSPQTGYFGNLTLKAVKDFQVAHNLTSDGVVGRLTNAQLNL